ncbi:hypothetical protein [Streptomyces luteogriseus]|uniref:hypothetical protein n=1 Tax=Streptomyces luteogriseus TaxID=68233 RepID=UPI0037FBC96E
MPMIVDPSAPQITPPTTLTSPDGFLTAVVDEQWAGVYLGVDYKSPADTARNLALNPSAEVDLSNTVTLGASITRSRITTDARFGTACVELTHTGAAAQAGQLWLMPEQGPGTTLRISIWVKVVSGTPTPGYIALRHGTDAPIQIPLSAVPAAGNWTRLDASYTLGPAETADRFGIALNGASGVVWRADAAMCDPSTELHPYVDGAQPGCVWDGTPHASTSRRLTSAQPWQDVRKVHITRQDPGAAEAVGVRSGDLAWAVEGVGQAYDHEAPLGVAVVYSARPQYADGSWGETSSLGLVVPAPAPAASRDLWLKSLDEPGLSMRVMYGPDQGTTSEGRQETADRTGTPYMAVAYDTAAAPAESVQVDVLAEDIEQFRRLIRAGVLLAQVRPGYQKPDRFFVPGTVGEKATGKLGVTGGYTVTFDIVPIERPAAAGQPMRAPAWSYDALAAAFATYDAVTASYATYAALATNGAVT